MQRGKNEKIVKYYTLLESHAQVGLESDNDSNNEKDMEVEEEDNKDNE